MFVSISRGGLDEHYSSSTRDDYWPCRRYNDISMWGPPGVALVRVVFSRRTYCYSRRRCCLRGCCCSGCRCCPVRARRARVVIGLSHSPPSPCRARSFSPLSFSHSHPYLLLLMPDSHRGKCRVALCECVCACNRCMRKSRATLDDEFAIFRDPSNSINYTILISSRPWLFFIIIFFSYRSAAWQFSSANTVHRIVLYCRRLNDFNDYLYVFKFI